MITRASTVPGYWRLSGKDSYSETSGTRRFLRLEDATQSSYLVVPGLQNFQAYERPAPLDLSIRYQMTTLLWATIDCLLVYALAMNMNIEAE